jgi:hypothetical protein
MIWPNWCTDEQPKAEHAGPQLPAALLSEAEQRLRRPFPGIALTSGNEFAYALSGGVSGAARRTWAAGYAERG